MTAVEVLVLASGALLTASALLALVRMARGPSGLDRAVAEVPIQQERRSSQGRRPFARRRRLHS